MNTVLAIFLGGGIGSLARFGVGKLVSMSVSASFPLGTFAANIISCIILGLTVGLLSDKISSESMKAFILIGFCGGFSTFSTFSYETVELLKNGSLWWAVLNISISVFTCVALLFLLVRK